MPEIIKVSLPEYTVTTEPNHNKLGKIIDDVIREYFSGQNIVVRGISSKKHLNQSIDDLINTILIAGTDRYDIKKAGDRYNNVQNKHIDIFAFRRRVTPGMQLFKHIIWGFYHGSKKIHGKPERIDVLLIYDANHLKAVAHQYDGHQNIKRDGFVFKNPDKKAEALMGIINIT